MTLTLLPAVDVADGQAVRLVQGAAGSETSYGDPLEAALAWQNDGAEWVHLVDLDAAFGRGSNRELLARVVGELDEIYADGAEYSFGALRQMPGVENPLKETLRLPPPLIILMRVAQEDVRIGDYVVRAGQTVAASPAVSNRLPEDFPEADAFDPDRYAEPRQEDIVNRWTWIPFGAGRHRCVGAAFAQLQIKAIFSVLLREFEFELAQPAESYHNDHSKMVVQLAQPCTVRYRRRSR